MDKESILDCLHKIPNGQSILQELYKTTNTNCFVMVSVLHKDCIHLFYKETDVDNMDLQCLHKIEPHILVSILHDGAPNPRAVTLKEVLQIA